MELNLSNVKKVKKKFIKETFRIDHADWNAMYQQDVDNGVLIEISDPKIITESLRVNKESLFNSKFNIPTEIDGKIIEYSCQCEKLIGRYNEGQICPHCNTVVEIRYSIELLRRGWINLGDYKIIVPAMYNKIRSYIGRKKLDEIINIDPSTITLESLKFDSTNPFKGIGIVEFERRYVEILEFFKHTTTKPELLKILLERKDITFSNKILVMSTAHRPGYLSTKNKSFSYHDINALFVKILTDYRLIVKGRRSGRKAVEIIGNIQQYLMQIYQLAFAKLLGKKKLIRSNIISGKMWYSSRMVIVSETGNDGIDCIRMSYKAFLGLFELEIMNCMLRGYGNPNFAKMTTAECRMYLTKVKYSNKVDEDIYSIIQTLLYKRKDDGIWVIIDRNPSLNLGSMQCFKIVEVFKDARKNVLTIPHNSLSEYSGDYDGDVLNVYSPKEKCVVEAFKEGFRPSKLILDRTGGYYNSNMAPIKDEYAFLRVFFDKDFNPVDSNEVQLRKLDDILKDVKDPFNYKKIKALQQLASYRKEIANNTFYKKENVKTFDIFDYDKDKNPINNKYYFTQDSVDPIKDDINTKRLKFDIFNYLDRSGYKMCK